MCYLSATSDSHARRDIWHQPWQETAVFTFIRRDDEILGHLSSVDANRFKVAANDLSLRALGEMGLFGQVAQLARRN
jgi:hypothetical protein